MNNIYENIDGQEELNFQLLFLYNQPGNDLPPDDPTDESGVPSNHDINRTSPCIHQDLYGDESVAQLSHLLTYEQSDLRQSYGLSPSLTTHPGAFQGNSPRIEITCSDLHHHRDHVHTTPLDIDRPMLTVPGYDMPYRESQCLSPASSNSSTSWHSDGCSPGTYSPCISPGGGGSLVGVTEADLCPRLQAIQASGSPNTSPRTSITEETFLDRRSSSPRPGSRSASPQGKRTYDQYQTQRSQSPHFGPDEPLEFCGHLAKLEDSLSNLSSNLAKPIATKIVRPNPEYSVYKESQAGQFTAMPEMKKEFTMQSCYFMPADWSSQTLTGVCSVPVAALPALDWPLPSSADQYELRIEVQPRQHHRAHYETEGSRGAVKASSGGHPVVQLRGYTGTEPLALQIFIGTSDDRNLRPHAFYQVHRITGKTVTTSSQERILNGSKVLEVPLEPKENMRAVVDCAGILKLRNADIELKKGETDIGRKNTRVKLVFRVHVPQPGGQWLSLQVASQTIECSQRSVHEQPAVECQDVDHCSVLGGLQMTLRGQNFTPESRVIFFEKAHVDLQIWDAEAKVYRDKSTANLLFLEIPSYRDPNIYYPVKVNFHVLNGKKRHSQPQHFTYTPLSVPLIKAEPVEEYQYTQLGCPVRPIMRVSPPPRHLTDGHIMPSGPSCLLSHPGMYPTGPQHHLQQQPIHYQLDHALPGDHAISPGHSSCMAPTHAATSLSSFRPNTYQHNMAGDAIQMAASLFPTVDISEMCSAVGHQKAYGSRASPTTGRSPPVHSLQTYLPVQHQRTSSPVRVTIKKENLDQAYLDDVNAVIRKDLVPKNDR
ncbi:nuclear factor of activated T-cells, cytoplasmic 2-like [Xyrauchen texanus]|uniref:nuclear factor of activated T-cells, cytoplasmic 2-like n=1 Tax=Xyrauchen texanus TaxID=154827 RepID=UPI002241E204|nr:nuclear factor of activated T-cells, cytoplasmic 2-like [Xyrauchen texanus]